MPNSMYEKLGVTPMINAAGTYTKIGGSRMSEQTLRDMADAARSHVDIKELQDKVGERLAELTKNEAACVCNGAAAGIYLATAACIEKKSGRRFHTLSMQEIAECEIIMFAAHRIPYDFAVRQLGATIKQVGYPNAMGAATREHLLEAVNEKTVGILYVSCNPGGWMPDGALDLQSTVNVAASANIPVVVDAAAQLPPVENLWRFTEMGADAALFSGGKDLRGPQSSGLVVGKKDFIDLFQNLNFFNYGIGRMLKTGREEIVGLLSAVEQYVNMDHKKRDKWVEAQIKNLIGFSKRSTLFKIERAFPNEAGQPMARAEIFSKSQNISLEAISDALLSGTPSIFTFLDSGRLFINPMTLFEGEVELIIARMKEIDQKV